MELQGHPLVQRLGGADARVPGHVAKAVVYHTSPDAQHLNRSAVEARLKDFKAGLARLRRACDKAADDA
eukprot:11740624-Alexandrium_andersonii.AAC.1